MSAGQRLHDAGTSELRHHRVRVPERGEHHFDLAERNCYGRNFGVAKVARGPDPAPPAPSPATEV